MKNRQKEDIEGKGMGKDRIVRVSREKKGDPVLLTQEGVSAMIKAEISPLHSRILDLEANSQILRIILLDIMTSLANYSSSTDGENEEVNELVENLFKSVGNIRELHIVDSINAVDGNSEIADLLRYIDTFDTNMYDYTDIEPVLDLAIDDDTYIGTEGLGEVAIPDATEAIFTKR